MFDYRLSAIDDHPRLFPFSVHEADCPVVVRHPAQQ